MNYFQNQKYGTYLYQKTNTYNVAHIILALTDKNS